MGAMQLSQKTQYGLRAIFELARRYNDGVVKTSEIAKAEAIPPRFLEVILHELKQAGFVDSKRGVEGGYFLLRTPSELTVGEILEFFQGPMGPVDCGRGPGKEGCRLSGDCVFLPLWNQAEAAVSEIYNGTSFQDLVDESNSGCPYVPSYSI